MIIKKSQKIFIGILIFVILIIAIYLIWNYRRCPKYINCMPDPNRPGSENCGVPKGCEGITSVAY